MKDVTSLKKRLLSHLKIQSVPYEATHFLQFSLKLFAIEKNVSNKTHVVSRWPQILSVVDGQAFEISR